MSEGFHVNSSSGENIHTWLKKLDSLDGKTDGMISKSVWEEYTGEKVDSDISVASEAKRIEMIRKNRIAERLGLAEQFEDEQKADLVNKELEIAKELKNTDTNKSSPKFGLD